MQRVFSSLKWQRDRMLLDDLVFRLQHYKSNDWELGEECFVFYKIKELVDQYELFFVSRPAFKPKNVFELGMFDGGSVAFWYELFGSEKHVAIDIKKREDSSYFKKYVAANGLANNVKTFWDTDQTDGDKLRRIFSEEFNGPLDLVIDDASHLYGPTRASFEILFPLLRPGGLYIIEDWAWGHWEEFFAPGHGWARQKVLTKFIVELLEATGSSQRLIANMAVYRGFAVIERGVEELAANEPFKLEDYIKRRPERTSVLGRVKQALKG